MQLLARSVVLLAIACSVHGFTPTKISTGLGASARPLARAKTSSSSAVRHSRQTCAARMATPAVDAPAPDFDLLSDSGNKVSLKSLRGKWVVLYFYPKVFTSGCTCQAEAYEKDVADFRSKNCEVLGISTNPIEKIKEFKSQYGLSFTMLSDRECSVVAAYGAALKLPFVGTFANRFTFIIDPQGVLRASFGNVDPKMDSIVVYARLLELQNPK